MDESHNHNIAQTKAYAKGYVAYDSTKIKFKKRQNDSD